MTTAMDDFDGIEDAEASSDENISGQWFLPGNYVVDVQKVKMLTTRKKQRAFVIETKIVESDVPERRAGMRADCMFMSHWDSYLKDVKKFAIASTGCKPEEVDKAGVQ